MRDELTDLAMALASVMEAVLRSAPADVRRIADAYREGCTLVRTITGNAEGSRPRILAGFERYEAAIVTGDCAALGWLLAAIEERLGEGDLEGAAELHRIVTGVARDLQDAEPTLH